MFDELSAGYYVGQLYIDLSDGEHAVMEREQHEGANEQIYATGEGAERTDLPLIVKVDESYFLVFGADEVPPDTLAVPEAVLQTPRVDNPRRCEKFSWRGQSGLVDCWNGSRPTP